MKMLSSLICLLFSVGVFAQPQIKSNTPVDIDAFLKEQNAKVAGKNFPSFSVTLPDATTLSNADLSNHIVFVNFWFEACSPCMKEMDGLNQLYNKLANNPNFKFISFSFDPESVIQKKVEELNIKYKVIHLDRAECYRLNFGRGFPASFILDKTGKINFFKMGGEIDSEKSTEFIMNQIYPKISKML